MNTATETQRAAFTREGPRASAIAHGMQARQNEARGELQRRLLEGEDDTEKLLALAMQAGMPSECVALLESAAANIRETCEAMTEAVPELDAVPEIESSLREGRKRLAQAAKALQAALELAELARERALKLESRLNERGQRLSRLRAKFLLKHSENATLYGCPEAEQIVDEARAQVEDWLKQIHPATSAAAELGGPWGTITELVRDSRLPTMSNLLRGAR